MSGNGAGTAGSSRAVPRTCVIVGASLAGGRTAESLRAAAFDGRVVLVGAEPDPPYERPPLTKRYLRGEQDAEALALRPADWYRQHGVELRLGAEAVGLDLADREVRLDGGERVPFDALVIATGSRMRRLQVPGAELKGVHLLRTVRDAGRLRAELRPGRRLVVVGAGFIGTEVAASARQLGVEVTVLDVAPRVLPRLGPEISAAFEAHHRDHGVRFRLGESVAAFRGGERVEAVTTTAGTTLECDLVLVGIGVAPESAWLAGSGVALDRDGGVLVDEYCRGNVPGVYAAGDVASWWHPRLGERLRVEHFDNAVNQPVAAARHLLGQPVAYAPVPYVWSDQYDLHLQVVGQASRWDRVVLRGRPEDRSFAAFYLVGTRVATVAGVNRVKEMAAARRLVGAEIPDPEVLADPAADLRALAKATPARPGQGAGDR